jgi:hypothetical protein
MRKAFDSFTGGEINAKSKTVDHIAGEKIFLSCNKKSIDDFFVLIFRVNL